jgi:hypothetical protein
MSYRMTGNRFYLEHATKIADFLLNHPNMPSDLVPYWDFNAPDIPNAKRDTSAAAIIASALYELRTMADESKGDYYEKSADIILTSLSTSDYRASYVGDNHGFLLKHGVGFLPKGSEVDVPLSYGDYYFVEANIRKLRLEQRL